MKRILPTMLLIAVSFITYAQSFEGYVIYKNTYVSKIGNISDSLLTAMMGTTQKWQIKGSEYRSDTDGEFMQWQFYNKADNKIYTKISNSNDALFNYGDVNTDKVFSAQINKGVTKILGYKCDELILTCKTAFRNIILMLNYPLIVSYLKNTYMATGTML